MRDLQSYFPLLLHSLCSSCIRSTFVYLHVYHSLSPLPFFVLPQSRMMDRRHQYSLVCDCTNRRRCERASLTLTGYTACQPCSLGDAGHSCMPSPPLPSCPGSSVHSPSFPRLQVTHVNQKLHKKKTLGIFKKNIVLSIIDFLKPCMREKKVILTLSLWVCPNSLPTFNCVHACLKNTTICIQ